MLSIVHARVHTKLHKRKVRLNTYFVWIFFYIFWFERDYIIKNQSVPELLRYELDVFLNCIVIFLNCLSSQKWAENIHNRINILYSPIYDYSWIHTNLISIKMLGNCSYKLVVLTFLYSVDVWTLLSSGARGSYAQVWAVIGCSEARVQLTGVRAAPDIH